MLVNIKSFMNIWNNNHECYHTTSHFGVRVLCQVSIQNSITDLITHFICQELNYISIHISFEGVIYLLIIHYTLYQHCYHDSRACTDMSEDVYHHSAVALTTVHAYNVQQVSVINVTFTASHISSYQYMK